MDGLHRVPRDRAEEQARLPHAGGQAQEAVLLGEQPQEVAESGDASLRQRLGVQGDKGLM